MKKRMMGATHYRKAKGLKPILVYVSPIAHSKLLKLSVKAGSLQGLVREVLEKHVGIGSNK